MNELSHALIVGAGYGLSASLAKLLSKEGISVSLAARDTDKLEKLKDNIQAETFACDASSPQDVQNLFEKLDKNKRVPSFVIFNPSMRAPGPIDEIDVEKARNAIELTCYGAFLVAQQSVKRMKKRGFGAIFFTGATAGIKGFANSSVFAMGKFGLRGLAQSLARELHPQNIHIAHFVIDGIIASSIKPDLGDDQKLCPDEIARRYLEFYRQHRSVWSWEIEIRPWLERF